MPTKQKQTDSPRLSAGTQDLLKTMMKQSGISASQQRRLNSTIAAGAPLPKRCHPTSSAPEKPMCDPPRPKNRVVLSNGRVNPKMYNGSIRVAKDIKQVDRPKFAGGPRVDREKVKERYAETLTYGSQGAARRQELRALAKQGKLQPKPRRTGGDEDDLDQREPTYVDGQREFDNILGEISERQRHLETMQGAGAASHALEARMHREISVRVKRLETIDREQKTRLGVLEQQRCPRTIAT